METVKQHVDRGRRHFESKNYGRAEQSFLKALRGGVRYADVLNMLGVIYHSQGKFNNAIECFREALTINPNYLEAALHLAILHNDLGEYREAKSLYQKVRKGKASEINPILKGKIANQHAALADTYAGIGRLQEAIEEYKKALALCPTYKDIRTKLAVCYRDNRQQDLAVKELAETVRDHPDYLPARIHLGLAYYAKGKIPQAVREWTAVLKKDKNNSAAKMYLRISGCAA